MEGRFGFRVIWPEEDVEAAEIERICFPPNEACTQEHMQARVRAAADHFLVAVDPVNSQIAGYLTGVATDETYFRDEFFTDTSLHNPDGKNVMLLSLGVRPQYRMQGLATAIMKKYISTEASRGKRSLVLTCHEDKVGMYQRMGFMDRGICTSSWGGSVWHEMVYLL